ncbi:MAG: hypothetical protein D6768_11010 [Chloroflexi bacterium]|nr:MAG: hypothetical protein D6768_11010 [Chloroflexota bacterium]
MDMMLLGKTLAGKMSAVFGRFSDNTWEVAPSTPLDALHLEIYQLEQSLQEIATRPNRIITKPKPLTEQQKIIDLAG